MKKSPLQRKTRLQTHSTLKRSPMKRQKSSKARAKEFSPEVRQAVSERSCGICEMCKQRRAVHMHHVHYRSQGGMGDISNCLHVCLECHELCHSKRECRELAVRLADELAKEGDKWSS